MERNGLLRALIVPVIIFLSSSALCAQEEKITDPRDQIPSIIYLPPGTNPTPLFGKITGASLFHEYMNNEFMQNGFLPESSLRSESQEQFEILEIHLGSNRYDDKRN